MLQLYHDMLYTEADMVRFGWLLFTDENLRANQLRLQFIPYLELVL